MSEKLAILRRPTLGRPLQLGMLYDCRNEQFIPNITLWDEQQIAKCVRSQPERSTQFEITNDDNFTKKASSIGVEGELTLNVIAGLIDPGISLRFLRDRITSTTQARCVMNYSCTTAHKFLHMDSGLLTRKNVKHTEVLRHPKRSENTATHVVTGVVYGAEAHFIFDSKTNSIEKRNELSCSLKGMLTAITSITAGVDGKVSWSENDENMARTFSCRFYGDFALPSSPTTVEEAIDMYKILPTLLGKDNEYAVAKYVHLMPLISLDSSAPVYKADISLNLVVCFSRVCESLLKRQLDAKFLLQSYPNAAKLAAYPAKINTFVAAIQNYEQNLMKQVKEILPQLHFYRGNRQKFLEELLQKHELSPFVDVACDTWLKALTKHMSVIDEYMMALQNFPLAKPSDVIASKDTSYVVCLIISLTSIDEYLRQLQTSTEIKDGVSPLQTLLRQHSMLNSIGLNGVVNKFINFANVNKENARAKFVVVDYEQQPQQKDTVDSASVSGTISKKAGRGLGQLLHRRISTNTASEAGVVIGTDKVWLALHDNDRFDPFEPPRMDELAVFPGYDSMTVRWLPIGADDIVMYHVSTRKYKKPFPKSAKQRKLDDLRQVGTLMYARIKYLTPATGYRVSIRAESKGGFSEEYERCVDTLNSSTLEELSGYKKLY